jgi:hypothetical protein
MLLAALLLAQVPNDYSPQRVAVPRPERVAQASVTILAAEEVAPRSYRPDPKSSTKRGKDRQYRVRDGMPLIEFY